jgi:hypothetical protein
MSCLLLLATALKTACPFELFLLSRAQKESASCPVNVCLNWLAGKEVILTAGKHVFEQGYVSINPWHSAERLGGR